MCKKEKRENKTVVVKENGVEIGTSGQNLLNVISESKRDKGWVH